MGLQSNLGDFYKFKDLEKNDDICRNFSNRQSTKLSAERVHSKKCLQKQLHIIPGWQQDQS